VTTKIASLKKAILQGVDAAMFAEEQPARSAPEPARGRARLNRDRDARWRGVHRRPAEDLSGQGRRAHPRFPGRCAQVRGLRRDPASDRGGCDAP
jgi:hypothetical protein